MQRRVVSTEIKLAFQKLAVAVLEQAITDYRQLQQCGIVRNGVVIASVKPGEIPPFPRWCDNLAAASQLCDFIKGRAFESLVRAGCGDALPPEPLRAKILDDNLCSLSEM